MTAQDKDAISQRVSRLDVARLGSIPQGVSTDVEAGHRTYLKKSQVGTFAPPLYPAYLAA